ncbi:MAG: hypothetical protein KAH77_06500 [Thiomargarita sp.]|nr:hypothetical protein [Thiomargarita sp.]
MEKVTDEYSIKYDTTTSTIVWKGIMRLNGKEYDPITALLNEVIALEPTLLTFNLQELKALNSSGITLLGRFIYSIRHKKNIQLLIQGSQNLAWQKKSIKNFQRLLPNLLLEWQ